VPKYHSVRMGSVLLTLFLWPSSKGDAIRNNRDDVLKWSTSPASARRRRCACSRGIQPAEARVRRADWHSMKRQMRVARRFNGTGWEPGGRGRQPPRDTGFLAASLSEVA
jgi:hypothetical protein